MDNLVKPQGSISVLDPRNNSHAVMHTMHCFIFVNIIDFVVSAVVQQVYRKKSVPWNASFLPLNAPKCVWWPGCAQSRWGSLQRFPRPASWVKGGGKWEMERGGRGGEGEGRGEEGEERRKGEDPPMFEVRWCQWWMISCEWKCCCVLFSDSSAGTRCR